MASLMKQGKRYYCEFVFRGKRHCFPLGMVPKGIADCKADQVDYLLVLARGSSGIFEPGFV